jgi:crotonobetainyl-CoA:carnitine CoA-transferase CaiB-like acyl-CoA transferase
MLQISAYGQTGPYRNRPGFARIAHAFSGLSLLAGESDGPPVVPGSTSLGDYMSGMWGAIGVLLALRVVEETGQGQTIDIGLYESTFRVLDELAPLFAKQGFVRERLGAEIANTAPHSHYQTADGAWVALACSNDRMFERLAAAMDRPELARDERYNGMTQRAARRGEVNGMVADWIRGQGLKDVMAQCEAFEVPCAPLYSIKDIFEDPHYEARGDLERIQDPRAGELVLPASVLRLSETPPELRHAGRALGADNDYVYADLLGLSADRIAALRSAQVI